MLANVTLQSEYTDDWQAGFLPWSLTLPGSGAYVTAAGFRGSVL